MLNDNPELLAEIEEKVKEALANQPKDGKDEKKSARSAKEIKSAAKADEDENVDIDDFEDISDGNNDFFEEDIEIEE